MRINESILDKIDSRDFDKSSAEQISDSYSQNGRYLFQFTVNLNPEKYNGTIKDLFDEIITKIVYYLDSFRFINNIGSILFYEYKDSDSPRNEFTNVPDVHPNVYIWDNNGHPEKINNYDIEIYFDADFKSGREVYQLYRKFFLPVSYFKIIQNHWWLCYTDNHENVLIKDTESGSSEKTTIYYPGDTSWSWYSNYEELVKMCKCYLNKPDYTPFELLRDMRYNNIDAILMNDIYKNDSLRENDTLKQLVETNVVKVVGHFNHINPAQPIYDYEKEYYSSKKGTPVAGYAQAFDAVGDSIVSWSSPWSPTSPPDSPLKDFCEQTPFTVYLFKVDDEDDGRQNRCMFLYDYYHTDKRYGQVLIALVSGQGCINVSVERALSCVMSPEDAVKTYTNFFGEDQDDEDEDEEYYEEEYDEDEEENEELNESVLDDLTTDDNNAISKEKIVKSVNDKNERKSYYRNTIRIITGAQIMPMDKLVQEPDGQFDMYEGNAYSIDRNREIMKSIKKVNARINDFLDACPFINQYAVTFTQIYELNSKLVGPRDIITGYIGDAVFEYSESSNNTQICVDVAFDHDDLRGYQTWRFIKALYSCVGNDDDKMNDSEFYPNAMTIRRGPYSSFYTEKFYGMYLKDDSRDKIKFRAFDTFCRRLCGENGKPFSSYLRKTGQQYIVGKSVAEEVFSNAKAKNTLIVEKGSMNGMLNNYGMTFDEIYLYDPSWDGNTVFIQGILTNNKPNYSHDDLSKEKFTEELWQWIQRERPDYLLYVQTSKDFVNVRIVFYGTTLKAYGYEYIPVIKEHYGHFSQNDMLARCLRIISFATGRPVEDILNDKEMFPKSVLNAFKRLK